VKPEVVKQLVTLNESFYSQFAHSFSETRSSGSGRLDRVLGYIPSGARVLDVGCGNGRLVERLEREGRSAIYVGVDAVPELVAIAETRRNRLHLATAEFRVADITAPGWNRDLPHAPFHVAVALAVLHHIPSHERRSQLLRDIHAVLQPGGTYVMTNWHFARNERMRKKVVDWATVGIDERELEPGDALLHWKRGGTGYRYCHLLTQAEVKDLAAESGFQVAEQFYADADLNLYSVLKKDEGPFDLAQGRLQTKDEG
jgi:2-polyprenyl-3-methyl-5-hydroxy-6-metoxy-1,4-benzoquinol methylase